MRIFRNSGEINGPLPLAGVPAAVFQHDLRSKATSGQFLTPMALGIGALFLIAALFYARLWPDAPVMSNDSPSYMHLARDLQGGSLSSLSLRTPGLPLLLLLTGSAERPTRVFFYVSLLLHFGASALALFVMSRLGVRSGLIWLTAGLAVLPPFVEPAAYLLSETLSEFVVIVAFALLLAWVSRGGAMWLIAFACAAAFAALVRPAFQFLVPALIPAILLSHLLFGLPRIRFTSLVRSLCLAALLSGIGIGSWAVVNYLRFGYFGSSGIAAYSMSTKTVPTIDDLPDRDAALRDILVRYRNQELVRPHSDHTGKDYIFRAAPELRANAGGDEVLMIRQLQGAYSSLIRTRPLSYLTEVARTVGLFWLPNDNALSTGGLAPVRYAWFALQLVLIAVFFGQALTVCGLLAFYASTKLLARRADAAFRKHALIGCAYLAGTTVIIYTATVSSFLGTGEARYRQPVDLLIVAVAIIGISFWESLIKAGRISWEG